MYIEARPWKTAWIVIGIGICVAVILIGLRWPQISNTQVSGDFPFQGTQTGAALMNPFVELLKLIVSALSGLIITYVYSRCQREKPLARNVQHAQVMLCVSSTIMMIIIGDSVARALGIAGGAAIIRFRTALDDPKDATIFLIVLGLGMASGMGAFAVVGFSTLFIALFLMFLDNFGQIRDRTMFVQLEAHGPDFPTEFVQRIFAVYGLEAEPGEVIHDKHPSVKYRVRLPHGTPLDDMTAQLMAPGTGLRSCTWEKKDKK